MKPRHAAVLAAFLGLAVPLILLGAFWVFHLGPDWSGLLLLLWPSSLQLMVLEFHPSMSDTVFVYAMSIGINVMGYAAIGWLAALFYSWSRGTK